MSGPTFEMPWKDSDERLAEMILYISQKCQTDSNFGSTKLNKILFFADFMSFQQRGKPITGTSYMRLGFGPVPSRLLPVRAKLKQESALVMQHVYSGTYTQKRPVAMRPAKLSMFDGDDINFVNFIIDTVEGHNAKTISDMSHMRIWRIAKDKEKIPYEAIFVSDDDADQQEIDFAKHELPEFFRGN